jgi:rare lipoprotein A
LKISHILIAVPALQLPPDIHKFGALIYFTITKGVLLKSLSISVLIIIVLGLAGFSAISNNAKTSSFPSNIDEFVPVTVKETTVNTSAISFISHGTMKSSWYGPRFHGKKTASGETYDQMAFTAAHKSMKFGTLLRVTNPKNNKSVIVRVNDRGPYIPGRQLDLSMAAAIELGIIYRGVGHLKVEELTIEGIDNPVVMNY